MEENLYFRDFILDFIHNVQNLNAYFSTLDKLTLEEIPRNGFLKIKTLKHSIR